MVADAAPMVYVNDTLYKQSTSQTSYTELKEEFVYLGEIESEVINDQSITDGIPNKNFQANHSIVGSEVYQYGDDIVVEINGKYWLYERLEDNLNETVEFHGELFNKADLSKETLEWLERYNALSSEEQLAISYVPYELYSYENTDSEANADNYILFHGKEFNKADLSAETLEWLERYNELSETEQLAISSIPSDLYELCGYGEGENTEVSAPTE